MSRRDRDKQRGLVYRIWMLFRHDIGRKLTALTVAVALWYSLANRLTLERRIELQVREVATRAEADQLSSIAPALYLVVPPEFIVLHKSRASIRIDVKGNKDDVRELDVSGIIEFDIDALGDQDEAVIPRPLVRDVFKAREGEPSLTEFEVRPPKLDVTLARRIESEIELRPENVVVVGRPREGYAFDGSSIRIVPNRVRVSGPVAQVENIIAKPEQLKLAPIDINGRILEVSQQVGIDTEKVDRRMRLHTAGEVVEVSIPVRPRDITKELLSVPVEYDNDGALTIAKRRVVFATETVDLLVTGPRSVLEGLTREELADRIRPVFDWGQVTLPLGDEKVRIFKDGLPTSVTITDLQGRPPEIHYSLESVASDPKNVPNGESP